VVCVVVLVVEEFRCGCWVHEGRPDLFVADQWAVWHAVFWTPTGGVGAGYEFEDQCHEVGGDRSGDSDGGVCLVAVVGADVDADGTGAEFESVLVAVAEGVAGDCPDGCAQSADGAGVASSAW
jgi:hypothetical protein